MLLVCQAPCFGCFLEQPWRGDPSGTGNPPVGRAAPGAADCSAGKDGRTAVEPLHTQSSVVRRTARGCSEVIFGSLLRTVGVGGTGGLLQGARAGPLHRESRSHPLLHLWRVQNLFSVISGPSSQQGPSSPPWRPGWVNACRAGRSTQREQQGACSQPLPALPEPCFLSRPRSLCSRSWGQAKNRTWDLPGI